MFAGGPWLWVRCTVDRTMVTNPLKDLRPCLGYFVALPPVRSCQLCSVFCEIGQFWSTAFVWTILYSGSLGSGVDEERSKLRVGMWTAGHMSIDTLNAYCGSWLVHYPCLAQGRFNIHPTNVVGIGLFPLLLEGGFKMLRARDLVLCWLSGWSQDCLGWLQFELLLRRDLHLVSADPLYSHDLRADKITRQI